ALAGSGTSSEEGIELIKLFILCVLIIHLIDSERRLKTTMGALVLFTAWLGVRTIWQYQNGEAMMMDGDDARALATGIFGDPNDLALVMAMALPLALGGCSSKGPWAARLLHLVSVPILVWTIFVTDSRGGMLALGAAVFFF